MSSQWSYVAKKNWQLARNSITLIRQPTELKIPKAEKLIEENQESLARQADPEFSSRKAVVFFLTSSTGRRCPLLG